MLDYNRRLATLSFGYSLPNREMPTSFQSLPQPFRARLPKVQRTLDRPQTARAVKRAT
jgi:hypothetical protein